VVKKIFQTEYSTTLYDKLHFTWLIHLTIHVSFASHSLSSCISLSVFFSTEEKISKEVFPNGQVVKIRDTGVWRARMIGENLPLAKTSGKTYSKFNVATNCIVNFKICQYSHRDCF